MTYQLFTEQNATLINIV